MTTAILEAPATPDTDTTVQIPGPILGAFRTVNRTHESWLDNLESNDDGTTPSRYLIDAFEAMFRVAAGYVAAGRDPRRRRRLLVESPPRRTGTHAQNSLRVE